MTNRPLIIAHRGARKYAPENSIPAFKKAIELGIDGVEFDVMSTCDGVPVVVHDDNLIKLADQHIHVHKTPYIDLKNIDIGRKFNPYFSGETIPTLKEVLEVFADANTLLNIELKEQANQYKNFVPRIIELINQFKKPTQIIVSSFSRNLLYKFGREAPHIRRALLLRPKAFFFLDVLFFANILAVHGINPHMSLLNKYLIKYARGRGLKIITWTVNGVDDIKRAVALGVDAIVTDDPLLAMEIINGGDNRTG